MHKIQEIFNLSYNEYCKHFNPTIEQNKAAFSIMSCKSGKLGCNISICDDCGHFETHNNSCRNRHCPCCQAILKELWIDKRKSEVIRGKFLARLQEAYAANKLTFSSSCKELRNSYNWNEFRDSLYTKQWIPFIKETFNGFGNAIDYLGRYTHRIAISNSRIKTVTNTDVTFTAKDYRTNETNDITITNVEFIRRFLMHVLPSGFQKIRYYGFLNNRYKKINLKLISKLTGMQLFKSLYSNMNTDELLLTIWNVNVHLCPNCGCDHFRHAGRTYHLRN